MFLAAKEQLFPYMRKGFPLKGRGKTLTNDIKYGWSTLSEKIHVHIFGQSTE